MGRLIADLLTFPDLRGKNCSGPLSIWSTGGGVWHGIESSSVYFEALDNKLMNTCAQHRSRQPRRSAIGKFPNDHAVFRIRFQQFTLKIQFMPNSGPPVLPDRQGPAAILSAQIGRR